VGHQGKITSLSLSSNECFLISAGTDKVIKLWCLRQKCQLAEYKGHLKTIWSVCFSKSGYFFVSGSADKTIKLWSTDDPVPRRVLVGHHLDVLKVGFLANPDFIASASEDKTVKIWNSLTAQCLNVGLPLLRPLHLTARWSISSPAYRVGTW
jgi:transcription initiation factor TFIID subunit 5